MGKQPRDGIQVGLTEDGGAQLLARNIAENISAQLYHLIALVPLGEATSCLHYIDDWDEQNFRKEKHKSSRELLIHLAVSFDFNDCVLDYISNEKE